MIHTYIPYCPGELGGNNLGWAYNNFMTKVEENDWVCFLDHDATFTTLYWYHQLEDIIKTHPSIGLFTAVTNRIGQTAQVISSVDQNNHDIAYHRKIGESLQQSYALDVEVLDDFNILLSGVVILISKKTWIKTGGFKDGFLSVDRDIHRKCLDNNISVGLMKGFYVYHWYRADGNISHLNNPGTPREKQFYKKSLI